MNKKLLLCDDDATLLRFMSEFFQTEGSFAIVTATNGPEALRVAYREHPDLVVLDVMMPGMDGWEVCARLRELSDVPIILITGKSTEADKLRGFHLGVDDYVTKPFSFAELSARIQAILGRRRAPGADSRDVLMAGDVIIDVDKRLARRGETEIPLTPTEFRLLEYLARRQGHAVKDAELVEAIWGSYRSEDSTTVRRYIWLLRQKVEADPANPRLILTVRGYGYRIGSEEGHD
ncbi:MAG TPA: response regulator transcription factor [Anaerolineaceae bacterium]|nr:response regulator transcription factor [Anaerolineaceae bacterium]HPN53722.1 response regulator transcription factor [Anaerolineaceae bacterium]